MAQRVRLPMPAAYPVPTLSAYCVLTLSAYRVPTLSAYCVPTLSAYCVLTLSAYCVPTLSAYCAPGGAADQPWEVGDLLHVSRGHQDKTGTRQGAGDSGTTSDRFQNISK